jgi:LydA holin phage, holin superfamily III
MFDDYQEWVATALYWLWVPMLGAIGGLMGVLNRVRLGQHKFWSFRTAAAIAASAIMGGMSYGLFTSYGLAGPALGSAVGMAGYIGPRAIDDFYDWIKRKREV